MPLTNPRLPIFRRNVKITFNPDVSKGWAGRARDSEHLLNTMSLFFPDGEKFFIESVRYYKNRIKDPVLLDQVERFIYQEAMHIKEHARCNRFIRDGEPHADKVEWVGRTMLNVSRRIYPRCTQLAITCAMEHFTAMAADTLLRRQQTFINNSEPSYAQLWLWHAVEETEHKAVCFDVYRYICGNGLISYLNRIFCMLLVSLTISLATLIGMIFMKSKKTQAVKRNPLSLFRKLYASICKIRRISNECIPIDLYFSYFNYSFHPWNHDNSRFIEEWKERFPNFGEIR